VNPDHPVSAMGVAGNQKTNNTLHGNLFERKQDDNRLDYEVFPEISDKPMSLQVKSGPFWGFVVGCQVTVSGLFIILILNCGAKVHFELPGCRVHPLYSESDSLATKRRRVVPLSALQFQHVIIMFPWK
jgi:hypothetical protein